MTTPSCTMSARSCASLQYSSCHIADREEQRYLQVGTGRDGVAEREDHPMHTHTIENWTHEHVFLGEKHEQNERRTWFVVALTVVMMVGEITAGSFFGSMALLADGWHMGTHAAALGIAGAAYMLARRQSGSARFAFGTGKFGDLAAFASAIIL